MSQRSDVFNRLAAPSPLCDEQLPEVLQERLFRSGATELLTKDFAASDRAEFGQAPSASGAEAAAAAVVAAATEAGSYAPGTGISKESTTENYNLAQVGWNPTLRMIVVQSLRDVMFLVGLEYMDWFVTVLILDIFYKHVRAGTQIEALVSTWLAIVGILDKAENACSRFSVATAATHSTAQFLAVLRRCYPNMAFEEATPERIRTQEQAVMAALQWRVLGRPTVFSWLQLACTRLSVISMGTLSPQLPEVWSFSLAALTSLMVRYPTSSALQPRRAANGTLALCFVRAGMVCPEALRLSSFKDADNWQDSVNQAIDFFATEGSTSVHVVNMLPQHPTVLPAFLTLFLTSACVTLDELREDVQAVVRIALVARAVQESSARENTAVQGGSETAATATVLHVQLEDESQPAAEQ
jgi:hypothetical protein